MCGRYVAPDTAAIERAWHIGRRSGNQLGIRYNVAPTMPMQILRGDLAELELADARWGFIPRWWKVPQAPTSSINARSEEAAGKPMWKEAYRTARCLIPAVGWYEWRPYQGADPRSGKARTLKQPYYLHVDSSRPAAFAGLWAVGTLAGQGPVLTCAILTRAASPSAAEVHDRMPVILQESAHGAWLDPGLTDAGEVAEIVKASAIGEVKHRPVSPRVNRATSEGGDLIEPTEEPAALRRA